MTTGEELAERVAIAAKPDCEASQAARLLQNVKRLIAESGTDLSEAEKVRLIAAAEGAKKAAVANFERKLAKI